MTAWLGPQVWSSPCILLSSSSCVLGATGDPTEEQGWAPLATEGRVADGNQDVIWQYRILKVMNSNTSYIYFKKSIL